VRKLLENAFGFGFRNREFGKFEVCKFGDKFVGQDVGAQGEILREPYRRRAKILRGEPHTLPFVERGVYVGKVALCYLTRQKTRLYEDALKPVLNQDVDGVVEPV
jgi:hypothetical protein